MMINQFRNRVAQRCIGNTSRGRQTHGPIHPAVDEPGRKALGAGLVAVAIGLLGACGSPSSASGELPKTIVFSVPSLQIAAMKQMATGVEALVKPDSWKVVTQDGSMDGQQQAKQLSTVVASGTAGALWIVALTPSSLKQVVRDAQAKGIPVVTTGTPSDYGFAGLQPGITFDSIDYQQNGEAVGRELGKCINEKLGGNAEVVWGRPPVGSAGQEDMQKAQKSALQATAPHAKIVSEVDSSTLQKAQTDIANALQGHPNANAVMGSVDEFTLGATSAFASAGKELPCLVGAGGNQQIVAEVQQGKVYAVVALQFSDDLAQEFQALGAMRSDPKQTGKQLHIPQKIITADK